MYDIICSLVIYNNDKHQLEFTIQSFLVSTLNVRLFLIDNSPTDHLKCLATDSRVEYFHNPSNPGFGAAHNIVLKKSIELNVPFHLVLNPDVYIEEGTLEKIFEYIKADVKAETK